MNKLLAIMLASMIVIPSHVMAMELLSYFNQGAKVFNETSNPIFVTDPASKTIHDKSIPIDKGLEIMYASERFTSPGQTFSHTINVYSGVDLSPICSNSSYLVLNFTSETQKLPITSNPSRCEVSSYVKYDNEYGKVFGLQVIVKDQTIK